MQRLRHRNIVQLLDTVATANSIYLILEFCKEPKSVKEIMEYIGLKHRPTFMYDYLKPLLEKDKLQMTIPDKPKSRNQKYVTILQKK